MATLKEALDLCKKLNENFNNEYDFYPSYSYDAIEVTIRGDWKHDHMWVDEGMWDLGFDKVKERLVEEGGSDYYSSTHYFKKNIFYKEF